jgi:hypothetical protein
VKSKIPIPLHSPEIAAFNGYLEALKLVLVGVNYVTHFEAKAFDLPNSHLPISTIMLMAYPNSKPDEAYIKECSLEILLEITDPCFSYPDASFTKSDTHGVIAGNLRAGFWQHLENCIDYKNASIHSYNSEVGLPGYDVFWSFSWLIHNAAQKRCVFLYGGSSD